MRRFVAVSPEVEGVSQEKETDSLDDAGRERNTGGAEEEVDNPPSPATVVKLVHTYSATNYREQGGGDSTLNLVSIQSTMWAFRCVLVDFHITAEAFDDVVVGFDATVRTCVHVFFEIR